MRFYSINEQHQVLEFEDQKRALAHKDALKIEDLRVGSSKIGKWHILTTCSGFTCAQQYLFETAVWQEDMKIGSMSLPTWQAAELMHSQVVEGLQDGKPIEDLIPIVDGETETNV